MARPGWNRHDAKSAVQRRKSRLESVRRAALRNGRVDVEVRSGIRSKDSASKPPNHLLATQPGVRFECWIHIEHAVIDGNTCFENHFVKCNPIRQVTIQRDQL